MYFSILCDLEEKIKNIGLGNEIVPINKILDDSGSFENNESIVLDKHKIFREKCNLCKNSFHQHKFGCLLCPNYFLCNKCEENHPHPMIKFKYENLSDSINKIITIYSNINKKEKGFHESVKKNLGVKNIKQLELRTNIASNSF